MRTHENFSRKHTAKGPSDRSFGWVFTIALAVIGLLPLLRHRPMRLWCFGVSAVFLILTLAAPSVLGPLNRAWMKLALALNRVVTPVITGVLFYVVITPIAVLFRMRGKDLLRLRTDPTAKSYWLKRDPAGPAPESMANQF